MHTHTLSTRYTNSLFLYPHPSTPLTTQEDDEYKKTALIYAAANGHVEAAKALVAADPDPAHLNMKVGIGGWTALVYAIQSDKRGIQGCAECAAVLRAAGAKE